MSFRDDDRLVQGLKIITDYRAVHRESFGVPKLEKASVGCSLPTDERC